MKLWSIALLFLAGSVLSVSTLQAQIRTGNNVTGTGGGTSGTANTSLQATIGQPIIGQTATNRLQASQGFWHAMSRSTSDIIPEPVTGEQFTRTASVQCTPNPFAETTTFTVSLPSAGHISLILYDDLGRMVRVVQDGHHSAGSFTVDFSTDELPSGRYTAILETGILRQSLPVIIVQ